MLALRAETLVVRSEDRGPWRRPYAAHTTNKRRLALQDAYVPRCRPRRCLRRPRVLLARVRGPRASLRPAVTGAGHGAGDTQSRATAETGRGARSMGRMRPIRKRCKQSAPRACLLSASASVAVFFLLIDRACGWSECARDSGILRAIWKLAVAGRSEFGSESLR